MANGHGGKRRGAGRKVGSLTTKTRHIAEQAAAEGVTPLEVMLANMRHFHNLAESAEEALCELSAEKIADLAPDKQFQYLLAQVKTAARFREESQKCASDAAPYIHPRLQAITNTAGDDLPAPIHRIELVAASHPTRVITIPATE